MRASWKQTLVVAGLALALLLAIGARVFAAPLDDARAAGLVGERPDGYLAAVQPNPPPDIAALVKEINAKRRAAYEDIAKKQNVPVDEVGALTAEKIKAKARAGEYFLNADGTWTKK